MTNEKMEQRLAAAVEKTAPDDVNGVLSRCESKPERKSSRLYAAQRGCKSHPCGYGRRR